MQSFDTVITLSITLKEEKPLWDALFIPNNDTGLLPINFSSCEMFQLIVSWVFQAFMAPVLTFLKGVAFFKQMCIIILINNKKTTLIGISIKYRFSIIWINLDFTQHLRFFGNRVVTK